MTMPAPLFNSTNEFYDFISTKSHTAKIFLYNRYTYVLGS